MLAKAENALTMEILRREQQRIGGQIKDGKLFPIGPHLTALLPLVPETELQRRWHVVQTEPQQEAKVAKELQDIKFDVFNPQVPKLVRVNDRKHRTIKRPMLPGYVFAGFDAEKEQWKRRLHRIHGNYTTLTDGIKGVLRVLMIGERPVPIPDPIIAYLREREIEENGGLGRVAKGPLIKLKTGSFVRILEPICFAGLFGAITLIDDVLRKIDVEIDIFGRMVPLRLEPEQVENV